jgi:hypothetical protein
LTLFNDEAHHIHGNVKSGMRSTRLDGRGSRQPSSGSIRLRRSAISLKTSSSRSARDTATGSSTSSTGATANDGHRKLTERHDEIELLLIASERERINELFRSGNLKDEARRRIERELDLREVDLANQWIEQ